MNQKIDLKAFISKISIDLSINEEAVSEIVMLLFTQIRKANEEGEWVYIEGLGNFHPLWYGFQKRLNLEADPLLERSQTEEEKSSLNSDQTPAILALPLLKFYPPAAIRAITTLPQEDLRLTQEPKSDKESLKEKIAKDWEETKLKHYHQSLKKDIDTKPKDRPDQSRAEKLHRKKKHKLTILISNTFSKFKKIKIPRKLLFYSLSIALVIIVSLFAITFYTTNPLPKIQAKPSVDAKDESLPKPQYKKFQKEQREQPNNTYTAQEHYLCTVSKGDSLYALSASLYGDTKYWPLIYVKNMQQIKDMDRIFPDDILLIPRIPKDSSAKNELARVYIQAYKAYKGLGKTSKAHWLLYWGQKHIDKNILKTYKSEIDREDITTVEEFIKRFD